MVKQKPLNFIILLFILSFVYQGCNIKQPTAPSWDVSFNLPIAKKYYTLSDIIEKKSDLIKNYTSGANKDILYYSNVNTIDEIKIKNQLKVDGTSQTVSNTIGIFSIKDDSVNTSLGYSWLDPTLQAGSLAPIPNAANLPINNTDFTLANQFSSVTINSGSLNISIVNYFPYPVNLTLNSLSIINKSNGSIIYHSAPNKIIPYLSTVALDPYQFPSNTLVENNLQFVGNVSINGNNTVITLPSYSIKLTAKFSNLELSQAVANIPEQDVQVNGNITFDNGAAQPTKIQRIVIDSGTLSGSVTNNSNVDALATITLINFIKPNGIDTLKILSLPIPHNQTINVFSNLSLQGYSVINPVATNLISYSISVKTIGTSDFRSVRSADNFSGNFSIGTLFLRDFTGQLKPTSLDPTRSSVSFDVKDIENKIQFQQLNLNSANIQIKLHVNNIQPGTLFKFGIDQNVSSIKAKNLTESFSLPLNSTTMDKTTITQSDSIITLNSTSMSNFFKQFKHLPDSIIVNVGGVLNPDYGTVSLTNQNNISGSSNIELPFNVGILGGQVADSVNIDLSQDDRNKIKDLNSIAAGIKITNGIPVALSFRGKLFDENNNFLMNFPPKHSDQDTVINIAGAVTDNTGNVTTKTNTTNKISLVSNQTVSETTLLSKAKYMRIYLNISTTRSNNQPVIFKTTNDLNITIYGSTDYQVKP
jgi:hypothetical protein